MQSLIEKYTYKTKNPHLSVLRRDALEAFIFDTIKEYKKTTNKNELQILDIGGGKGWSKLMSAFPESKFTILDLKCTIKSDLFIQGDITSSSLILPQKYDIIFTKDTFEHILNPWDATSNVINNLEENGIFIFMAPFSWRYHASPYDTFRYSHSGAQYLFERLGKLKKVFAGYIPFGNVGGFWKNNKDKTIDEKAFPNCLETIYIGQKDSAYEFLKENLDSDFSWDHSV